MVFDADPGILAHIREVELPHGPAHLFGCWESHLEEQPRGDHRDDNAVTLVFDSSSAENSCDHKPMTL